MPVSAIRTIAKAQNGVGAYIHQCRALTFHYCDWAGSSRGMNAFLRTSLPKFARANPQIEITVAPRPHKHPVIIGHYINGKTREVEVKNMTSEEVRAKATELRDTNGEPMKRVNKPVTSINESVRGIWSPFHGAKVRI